MGGASRVVCGACQGGGHPGISCIKELFEGVDEGEMTQFHVASCPFYMKRRRLEQAGAIDMTDRIDGWEEIAAYLGCDRSTAKRWEKKDQLPIRRATGGPKARVHAFQWELDNWKNGRTNEQSPTNSPHRGASDPKSDPKIVEQRLGAKLLRLYYPDAELRSQNLFRYSFSVNGEKITTNIATSDSWLGLAIPISERDHQKFPIRRPRVAWPPASSTDRERLQAEMKARGILFFDKPIYCLQSFDPLDHKAVASFSLAQYIDYKLKLGGLEEEITKALMQSGLSPDTAFSNRKVLMPLRNALLADSKQVASYGGRLCAGGTNVLFAMRRPNYDGYTFFVKRRSKIVSTGGLLMSLLPAGMHQPATLANAYEESSVASTVYRETYEEIFGGKEAEADDKHLAPNWFMSAPQLAWFKNNPSSFTMEIVSFGLNLVDGTYEFGVLVVVKDECYWETYMATMKPNEEVDDTETAPYCTLDITRLTSLMTDPRCADTSLIALLEGLRRLSRREPSSVKLPRIMFMPSSERACS